MLITGRHTKSFILVLTGLLYSLSLAGAAEQNQPGRLAPLVKNIDWTRFKGPVKAGPQRELCARVLLNSARYCTRWAIDHYKLDAEKECYLVPNKDDEPTVRTVTSIVVGLAVVIRTGLGKEQEMRLSEPELIQLTARLIKGVAVNHRTNGGKWGDHWQSSLWSAQLGRASWMLWDALDVETRDKVCALLAYEADRHLRKDYRVPYWNGKGGDTKAEENSWESMTLLQAVVTMPNHPNARRWKAACSELMISAYARKSDMDSLRPILDGKTPREWLHGFNANEDGTVVNHDRIHDDYMTCFAQLQMSAYLACSLAGVCVPETTDFNFECVYRALQTRRFESPPYEAPGGTMYVAGRAELYYPQGADWSRLRFASSYGMDAYAHILRYDARLPHKAAEWMQLRAKKILEMQSRHPDGHMYAPGEFDTYAGKEHMVLWFLSDAYLLLWLADHNALSAKGNWLADDAAIRQR